MYERTRLANRLRSDNYGQVHAHVLDKEIRLYRTLLPPWQLEALFAVRDEGFSTGYDVAAA